MSNVENLHDTECGKITIQPRFSQWANKFVGGAVAIGTAAKAEAPARGKKPAVKIAAPAAAVQAPVAAAAAEGEVNGIKILAPLPGTITSVEVKVGDAVKPGDVVIVLEAMKMQNNIEADKAGTVAAIKVAQGDSVMEGTVLVVLS